MSGRSHLQVAVTSPLSRVGKKFVRTQDGAHQAATLPPSMTLHCCPLEVLQHIKVVSQKEMSLCVPACFVCTFSLVKAGIGYYGAKNSQHVE